jgi:hypothetical protein
VEPSQNVPILLLIESGFSVEMTLVGATGNGIRVMEVSTGEAEGTVDKLKA